jgi:hypothetical protein
MRAGKVGSTLLRDNLCRGPALEVLSYPRQAEYPSASTGRTAQTGYFMRDGLTYSFGAVAMLPRRFGEAGTVDWEAMKQEG